MTKLVRFSPHRELNRMHSEFDRIFNDFFPGRPYDRNANYSHGAWVPSVDLSENEDGYNIRMDLPGVDKKDITVNYQDGILTISGTRNAEEKKEGDNFLRIERRSGEFSRSFKIPNAIQTNKINAGYENGVLNITLLKADEVKPVKVKVS